MTERFLHGPEILEVDTGTRTIRTARSSVIGLVGTAPAADSDKFPLNTPVLISGKRTDAVGLGATGTLPAAIDGIFDQVGAMVVLIRVDVGADNAATLANIVGGVDDTTGQYLGVHALLGAQSKVHVTPRILIAPGFTNSEAVLTEMVPIADSLRAIIVAEGPNTNDAAAITYRGLFGSARVYLVDPWVKVFDTQTASEVLQPSSARVAGVIAKSDAERGFWWSPSNREIQGITGLARPIDYSHGDANCRANHLNENEVTTIIQSNGYRLWGNRSCSSDQKYVFLSVRRTMDMIHESIMQNHQWAVDRVINGTYFEDVSEGVNAYIRSLKQQGAISGGRCWVDPDLNDEDSIEAGKSYFNLSIGPPYPAEHIIFQSAIDNSYQQEIII